MEHPLYHKAFALPPTWHIDVLSHYNADLTVLTITVMIKDKSTDKVVHTGTFEWDKGSDVATQVAAYIDANVPAV